MSISLVAKKAGVSQATVSYVLNNKPGVSKQTIAKVKKVIKELGYVPRASRTRSGIGGAVTRPISGNIGLAIPEGIMGLSQLNSQMFEAIHKELENRSLRLIPIRVPESCDLAETLANNNTISNLDGIVLFYTKMTPIAALPGVSVLGHLDPNIPLSCDHVEPDNLRIGALAAHYLVNKGHRIIATINPSTQTHLAVQLRCQQFMDSGAHLGVEAQCCQIPIELRCSETGRITGVTPEHPLQRWVEAYKRMPDRPTGIFVPSDTHLAIVHNTFRQAGIELENGIDFIGCNKETLILQGLSPMPATIDINPAAIARKAITLLLHRINSPVTDRSDSAYSTTYIEPVVSHL